MPVGKTVALASTVTDPTVDVTCSPTTKTFPIPVTVTLLVDAVNSWPVGTTTAWASTTTSLVNTVTD